MTTLIGLFAGSVLRLFIVVPWSSTRPVVVPCPSERHSAPFHGKISGQFWSNTVGSHRVPALHTDSGMCLAAPVTRMRAFRFPLHVPLHYRRVGEQHWHEGTVENISCSGVLLRAEDFLQVHT